MIEIGIYAGIGLAVLLILGLIITRLYRRATKEIAFVRTGFRGERVVMNGGALVLPVLHETMPVNMNTVRLAVERKNTDALITLDRLRIDVKAEFYVRVRPDGSAIAMAAQTLGLRTMQPEALKDLVEGKFVDALRSVAAGMTMNQLHEQRADFVQKVQQVSSNDLAMNGLELESVSLTGLDQTSIEHFNANNAFDAEGLTKLTEQIEMRKKTRNDIEQDTRVQMETKNLEAEQKSLAIQREEEFAKLSQSREIEVRRAEQAAEIAREQAQRNQEAENARIAAKQLIDAKQIEADRAIEEARIAQEQAIELARQEQQILIQNKSREESQARAEADNARALAVAAEEQVATARETEVAERSKRIELIEAAKEAERQAISVKVQAEAEKEAAANRASALRLEAEGEAEAEKLRAEAARVRFEVEAAGQRAINEAANILSSSQISLQTKMALLKVLPEVVREAAKPMEAIDSIKIVQVDGISQSAGGGAAGEGGSGNLASNAVSAALAYRAQAPVIDSLMKELGFDGGSLDALVKGAAATPAELPAAEAPEKPSRRRAAPPPPVEDDDEET
ncbi:MULTISPECIES: flotillin domain-containing protein [unclassified Sphingopyxis]|uniref:flotillin family protein n=1 Tax=unclassified Sphingopyxis TaxID=2614943 RepID=UPI00073009E8|nr:MULTISPECIES: flotillin domain-containing protein [unclassified Sphingopyxis]MBD3732658.1 flotillin family protein [Sphingopyxis sp.]KTE27398.1 flotillin [Sphingopyxis sp. H057]KTE54701.1 flotillin [Sphingopyxis sp. H073]KTE57027.1 flotillin [Sphingopyxis sp. H071]KTE60104.1 flotillin [Sphingopyxis sp. H107]